jgi:hypothetical protein
LAALRSQSCVDDIHDALLHKRVRPVMRALDPAESPVTSEVRVAVLADGALLPSAVVAMRSKRSNPNHILRERIFQTSYFRPFRLS